MGAGWGLSAAGAAPRDWAELEVAVREIGPEIGPETIQRSGGLLAPLHAVDPDDDSVVKELDVSYGPYPEQAVDLYLPEFAAPRGVVMYVHGGAFVGGARRRPGSPYHGNIGRWAARHGWVGALIGHRLAPAAQWPAAAEDVALAIDWCNDRFRTPDGAPIPVHLVGNSSGAVHAAAYTVGGPGFAAADPAPASLSLVSGIYDLPAFGSERLRPYFGAQSDVVTEWDLCSRLARHQSPVLFAVGEYDTPDAQDQLRTVMRTYSEIGGVMPHSVWARAANHFTTVHAIGTPFDALGPVLLRFFDDASRTYSNIEDDREFPRERA